MSRYTIAFALGAAGLLAGCAIGLMVAPASGAEVRRRLAWRLDEERRQLARTLTDLKQRVDARCAEEAAAKHSAA